MRNRMRGVMGIGLAIVLALTLALAAIPAADAVAGPDLQWNDTATPSINPDDILQPGTDLCDMAVSADGDTVYVAGMLGPSPYSDYVGYSPSKTSLVRIVRIPIFPHSHFV